MIKNFIEAGMISAYATLPYYIIYSNFF